MNPTEIASSLWAWTPYLLGGFGWNLLVALLAMVVGTALGAVLAVLRLAPQRGLVRGAVLLTALTRNVPTIVGTAVNLLAITATFVAPVALPIFIGTAVVSGITAARGVSKTGVYSDGSTQFIRGNAEDGAYVLHFATDEERSAEPYAGPPPPEAIAAVDAALQGIAASSAAAAASSAPAEGASAV